MQSSGHRRCRKVVRTDACALRNRIAPRERGEPNRLMLPQSVTLELSHHRILNITGCRRWQARRRCPRLRWTLPSSESDFALGIISVIRLISRQCRIRPNRGDIKYVASIVERIIFHPGFIRGRLRPSRPRTERRRCRSRAIRTPSATASQADVDDGNGVTERSFINA
jgi:hypothetical protein